MNENQEEFKEEVGTPYVRIYPPDSSVIDLDTSRFPNPRTNLHNLIRNNSTMLSESGESPSPHVEG